MPYNILDDVDKLLERAVEGIRRDLSNIVAKTTKGQLDKDSSEALVRYIRALSQMKKMRTEDDDSGDMTDEQLRQAAQELLNAKKK